MGNRLEGKAAVVTGAGNGIGRAIALALAAEGAKIVVNDTGGATDGSGGSTRPAADVAGLIRSMGGMAVPNFDSVADHVAAERIVKSCVDNFGKIDILANVAGVIKERMVWNLTEDDWDSVLDVHLKGTFNCTKYACGFMRQQGHGRIINTASSVWLGTIGQSNYSAAKAGTVGFTRSVALEMAKYNVTCNAIAPVAATRMVLNDAVQESRRQRMEQGLITRQRYEELLDTPGPEFVPPIVVYLATDQAAYISGKVFGCVGGRITLYSEPEPYRKIDKNHKRDGAWTLEELMDLVPKTLCADLPPLKKKNQIWA